MSDDTEIPTSGQSRARSEEVQRPASPTTTELSMSSTTSSPRSGRKRTNDEIYKASTGATPSHSKKLSINQRPRTAPEQVQELLQPSQFEQHGFPKEIVIPAAQSFESTVATLSTQPLNVSTAATAFDAPQTFVSRLHEIQNQLNLEYEKHERDIVGRDHKAQLSPYDWDNLERRYLEEMEPVIKSEQEIQTSLAKRYGRMLLWMQASSDRETHRAIKRLRTRVAFVQTSEAKLADKEQHYEKVLKAFQSTMALLGGA